ncbi:Hypothetical_protein [Hexamita inflata]|uniref:Hypothetical_protein n=1 Tax=Hexamita inflata TaxID=28002 RepID=A0ABP1JTZ9_9EUKA
MIKDMVQQLVALGELCFTGSGSQKKFNVKSQIQESLENQKLTTNEKIAGAYIDLLFKNTCNDNSKKQLIDLAKSILIAPEITGRELIFSLLKCICYYLIPNQLIFHLFL